MKFKELEKLLEQELCSLKETMNETYLPCNFHLLQRRWKLFC